MQYLPCYMLPTLSVSFLHMYVICDLPLDSFVGLSACVAAATMPAKQIGMTCWISILQPNERPDQDS